MLYSDSKLRSDLCLLVLTLVSFSIMGYLVDQTTSLMDKAELLMVVF